MCVPLTVPACAVDFPLRSELQMREVQRMFPLHGARVLHSLGVSLRVRDGLSGLRMITATTTPPFEYE